MCFSVCLKLFSCLFKLVVRFLGGFCNCWCFKNVGCWFQTQLSWSTLMWSDNNSICVLKLAVSALITYSSVCICKSFSTVTSSKHKDYVSKFQVSNKLYVAPNPPHTLLRVCSSQVLLYWTYQMLESLLFGTLGKALLSPWQNKMKMVVKNGCCHNFFCQSCHWAIMLRKHMSYWWDLCIRWCVAWFATNLTYPNFLEEKTSWVSTGCMRRNSIETNWQIRPLPPLL